MGLRIMVDDFGLRWTKQDGFVFTDPEGSRVQTYLDEQHIPHLGNPSEVQSAFAAVRDEVLRVVRESAFTVEYAVDDVGTAAAAAAEEVAQAASAVAEEVAAPAVRRMNNPLAKRDDRVAVEIPGDHLLPHLPKRDD